MAHLVVAGVLQGDLLASLLFIVLVDCILVESSFVVDAGIVIHPHWGGVLQGGLDFTGGVALLESSVPHAQSLVVAAALRLAGGAPRAECVTADCGPQPALGVCGGAIGLPVDPSTVLQSRAFPLAFVLLLSQT